MAMIAMIVGIFGGLMRLGISTPTVFSSQVGNHGAFMLSAFFGTVICLERAVALNKPWVYLAPLLSGLGGLAMILQSPIEWPSALFTCSGIILCIASFKIYLQQRVLYTLTLFIGALCWMSGNTLWLLTEYHLLAIPYGIGFLVLTIAGERLELTRFLPPKPKANKIFALLLSVTLIGIVTSSMRTDAGSVFMGAGLTGLALWLIQFDIARTTIRKSGLTRFVATCLLLGYGWLFIGGLLFVNKALEPGALFRDAALHAILLGFVMSMVIGHAPIIFPAVMRVKIPYSSAFYLPLVTLHVSICLRITGGFLDNVPLRVIGAEGNAIAILLFLAVILYQVKSGYGKA